LQVKVTARACDTTLAQMLDMVRGMETVDHRQSALLERVTRFYAPFVHVTAAITGITWLSMTGDWHKAITTAVAVLIITCPCAFGLALPMVQVVAGQRLFSKGILLKSASALERLESITNVVFDKTGTLTEPAVVPHDNTCQMVTTSHGETVTIRELIRRLTNGASHPHARSINRYLTITTPSVKTKGEPVKHELPLDDWREMPGLGIEAVFDGKVLRLGRASWAQKQPETENANLVFTIDGKEEMVFNTCDGLVPGAKNAVERLDKNGYRIELLSGDREASVESVAERLDIGCYRAQALPTDKANYIRQLNEHGSSVLFVGDGMNDAPALKAADVAMAPASATDVSRHQADIVYLHRSPIAVPQVLVLAKRAMGLIRQNILIAIGYNLVAVPFAVAGLVTPVWAALAMSVSSILVVANSMRLTSFRVDDVEQSGGMS